MNEQTRLALARQQQITAAAAAENRDLTEAEQREFDALQAIIDADDSADNNRSAAGGEARVNSASESGNEERDDAGGEQSAETDEQRSEGSGYSSSDAATISAMCRFYNVDASDFFARNLTAAQIREEIMERQMREHTPISTNVRVTNDESDKFRRAAADGILLKGGVPVSNPAEGANSFRALSLRDIAIEAKERSGGSENYRRMSSDKLFNVLQRDFYNPESAFPSIMDEVVTKSYVEGLAKAPVTFDKWVKIGSLSNFKKTNNHEYIMALMGNLEKVPENGELKAYVPEDVKLPERQLETYGRQFTLSRKAFIDDDIGLVTSIPYRFGIISKRTQNDLVYDLLLGDKKIYDGKTMFDKSRGNVLDAGTDITLEAVAKMIYKIGIQKDEAGNQLAIVPDIFIVPFGLGTKVKQLLTTDTFYSAEGTVKNPYYNSAFEVIEDVTMNARIKDGSAYPWFMGVKGEIIEVDYLNGQEQGTLRRSERPGTLGFVWDFFHDFNASVIHPQAVCKNPGIELTLG